MLHRLAGACWHVHAASFTCLLACMQPHFFYVLLGTPS